MVNARVGWEAKTWASKNGLKEGRTGGIWKMTKKRRSKERCHKIHLEGIIQLRKMQLCGKGKLNLLKTERKEPESPVCMDNHTGFSC